MTDPAGVSSTIATGESHCAPSGATASSVTSQKLPRRSWRCAGALRASRLSVLQSGVKSASAARAEGTAAAIAPRHATALNSFAFNRHMGRDTIKTRAIYECGRASMAIGSPRR